VWVVLRKTRRAVKRGKRACEVTAADADADADAISPCVRVRVRVRVRVCVHTHCVFPSVAK